MRISSNKAARPACPLGVRLCQVYFVCAMVSALTIAFLYSPRFIDYNISFVRELLLMSGGAATLWLMARRERIARAVGASTAIAWVLLAVIDFATSGTLMMPEVLVGQPTALAFMAAGCIASVAAAAYLLFSPQAKRALDQPPDLRPGASEGYSWDEPLSIRVRTWEFWRDLVMYFIVFSFLGHWAEMLFCLLIVAGVFMGGYDPNNAMLWSQWLFPFTAEGAAAVAIVLILHPAAVWLKKKTGNRVLPALLLSFLLNLFVCTSIDFLTGMVANQDYSLWDYRDLPFNFMGQVVLQNSLVYTIAATLIVWVFYPLMDRGLRRAPRGVVNAVAFALVGLYVFLAILHWPDPLFG